MWMMASVSATNPDTVAEDFERTCSPVVLHSTRPVDTLPLRPKLRSRLRAAGYTTLAELARGWIHGDITRRLGISQEELVLLQEQLHPPDLEYTAARSAAARWMLETGRSLSDARQMDISTETQRTERISTGAQRLDALLDGGLCLGQLVEICGEPGIGKTQLGMQLAVQAQLPRGIGGPAGETIYIDTEGSFMAERVKRIAEAVSRRVNAQLQFQAMRVPDVLHRIHYFRAYTHLELIALAHALDTFLQKRPKVRLVVVDSIAFPFRQRFENVSQRTRLITQVTRAFERMAQRYRLAVVFMNQMTTQLLSDQELPTLVPALGESWGYLMNTRVALFWRNRTRYAFIFKSPLVAGQLAPLAITYEGIGDVAATTNTTDIVSDEDDLEAVSPPGTNF